MTGILSKLKPPVGSARKRRRVGRGEGSGLGKTSGRGHKGQKSRSGGKVRRGFEGGQMPLQRRLPKRGFRGRTGESYEIVNVESLKDKFKDGDTVDHDSLTNAGFISNSARRVKLLGNGILDLSLTVKANKFSKTAAEKIVKAGGKAEVV